MSESTRKHINLARLVLPVMALLCARAVVAQLPTSENLAAALSQAKAAWGVESPDAVEIRAEVLNSCNLRENPHIAEIQPVTSQITTRFDDGSEVKSDPAVTWVIRINSACDWTRHDLAATVVHEYGHLVIGMDYHSQDKRSIMHYIVSGSQQKIMPADRALVKQGAVLLAADKPRSLAH